MSQTALDLDPELAEAYTARGFALSLNKECKEAENEFKTAIQLNPRLFEAYYFYARTCFAMVRQGSRSAWRQAFRRTMRPR